MLLRSHGGGNCSGDGGAHEGGPDLHPTACRGSYMYMSLTTYKIKGCPYCQNRTEQNISVNVVVILIPSLGINLEQSLPYTLGGIHKTKDSRRQ